MPKTPKRAAEQEEPELPQTDIPDAPEKPAVAALDHHEETAAVDGEDGKRALAARIGRKLAGRKIRGLYYCAWLAQMVEDLAFLQECVEFEASIEEDGSEVPGQLTEALHQLGQALVDMTEEEVGELLEGDEDDGVTADDASNGVRAVRALARMGRTATLAGKLGESDLAAITRAVVERFARAGRVLSADNERSLRDAHDHMSRACDMVRSVFEQVDPTDDDDDAGDGSGDDSKPATDPDKDRAARARRLKSIQLRGITAA